MDMELKLARPFVVAHRAEARGSVHASGKLFCSVVFTDAHELISNKNAGECSDVEK